MCDCIDTTEKIVFEKLKKDNEKNGIVNEVAFRQKSFRLSKGGGIFLYNDIEYEMTNVKKDGSHGATRKYTVSMYHSYCPFCGKEIKR